MAPQGFLLHHSMDVSNTGAVSSWLFKTSTWRRDSPVSSMGRSMMPSSPSCSRSPRSSLLSGWSSTRSGRRTCSPVPSMARSTRTWTLSSWPLDICVTCSKTRGRSKDYQRKSYQAKNFVIWNIYHLYSSILCPLGLDFVKQPIVTCNTCPLSPLGVI